MIPEINCAGPDWLLETPWVMPENLVPYRCQRTLTGQCALLGMAPFLAPTPTPHRKMVFGFALNIETAQWLDAFLRMTCVPRMREWRPRAGPDKVTQLIRLRAGARMTCLSRSVTQHQRAEPGSVGKESCKPGNRGFFIFPPIMLTCFYTAVCPASQEHPSSHLGMCPSINRPWSPLVSHWHPSDRTTGPGWEAPPGSFHLAVPSPVTGRDAKGAFITGRI